MAATDVSLRQLGAVFALARILISTTVLDEPVSVWHELVRRAKARGDRRACGRKSIRDASTYLNDLTKKIWVMAHIIECALMMIEEAIACWPIFENP